MTRKAVFLAYLSVMRIYYERDADDMPIFDTNTEHE